MFKTKTDMPLHLMNIGLFARWKFRVTNHFDKDNGLESNLLHMHFLIMILYI